jgi:hypothetical protein
MLHMMPWGYACHIRAYCYSCCDSQPCCLDYWAVGGERFAQGCWDLFYGEVVANALFLYSANTNRVRSPGF